VVAVPKGAEKTQKGEYSPVKAPILTCRRGILGNKGGELMLGAATKE